MPRLALPIAIWLCAPAAAQAQAAGPDLGCKVSGYDVVVTNTTAAPLPAGSAIGWSVRFARMEGTATLEADLPPGASVFMTAALGSYYLSARTPCRAWVPQG